MLAIVAQQTMLQLPRAECRLIHGLRAAFRESAGPRAGRPRRTCCRQRMPAQMRPLLDTLYPPPSAAAGASARCIAGGDAREYCMSLKG